MRVLNEGTRLADRYTLIRRLGRGGMSETWLANDRQTGGRVALKFLQAELATDSRRRDQFHAEWRLASRLMHAHIVRVFEYHEDEDGPYFSLQYLDGPPISDLTGQPLETQLRPFGLIADALRYAHGKGIVHRDVTAANVMFDRRGAPYLIDFGVAQRTGADAPRGGGTPVAQSPEQRRGEPARAADDIFALGVLMHEVITGMPPEGHRSADTGANGEKLPGSLSRLINDMLAEEASDRPDAETVSQRLADAGFAPGVAVLPKSSAVNETLDPVAVESIRPGRMTGASAAAAPVASRPTRGLSPSVVGAGLAVLLLAVFGVVFLLPDAVEPPATDDVPTAADATDGTAAATAASDEQGSTGDAGDDAASARPDVSSNQSIAPLPGDDVAGFSENVGPAGGASVGALKARTDKALGDLLSRLERLRYRGIERWGGQEYLDAVDRYAAGDEAYLAKNYESAHDHYSAASRMLEPLFDRIDDEFRRALGEARAAFEARDFREAIRLYDLAVTITPGNAAAEQGLERARNLEDVLALTERGLEFEKVLELAAARRAFENALELDPAWQPAADALDRVEVAIVNLRFEQLMTEGFDALASGALDSARAAFNAAKSLKSGSQQPVDGLLQVDQEERLARIRSLEARAASQVDNEQWEAAVDTYREALAVDPDLQFAKEGLQLASERVALHSRLQQFIEEPDSLSQPRTMQAATDLLLAMSRITPAGPRLNDQKEQLSRLLKRAATPLTVELVSDNKTHVSIFQVGKLGTFENRQLDLRPGTYVAVGSRPGYRDVRLEFRVAPEVDIEPIVVECEEPI
ncbi:MAG: protein kinase [Woeseia sp.]